jgi:hypothetical protein
MPFTTQEVLWYSFLLEAEATPKPLCGCKEHDKLKKAERLNRDWNLRPNPILFTKLLSGYKRLLLSIGPT